MYSFGILGTYCDDLLVRSRPSQSIDGALGDLAGHSGPPYIRSVI